MHPQSSTLTIGGTVLKELMTLSVLVYCSEVRSSVADTHLQLLDCVVIGTHFLTVSLFECVITNRRSVALLCMPCKIRCNPMQQCGLDVVSLNAHRYTYAFPCCRTSQNRRAFTPLSVCL